MRRLLGAVCVAVALLRPAAAQTTFTSMGRLFSTPAERMALDQQRNSMALQTGAGAQGAGAGTAQMGGTPGQAAAGNAPPALPAPPPATPVRLDGVIRRSNGQATIWVDNEAREATLRGRPGSGVRVDVGGRTVLLKPGQSYDPNTGMVVNAPPR